MAYEDLTLECCDCGCEFVFTEGEQEFYESKGLQNTPKRCNNCRSQKKQANRRKPRRMFDTVCCDCGCDAQVPFQPSEDKPVYCRDCFSKQRQ